MDGRPTYHKIPMATAPQGDGAMTVDPVLRQQYLSTVDDCYPYQYWPDPNYYNTSSAELLASPGGSLGSVGLENSISDFHGHYQWNAVAVARSYVTSEYAQQSNSWASCPRSDVQPGEPAAFELPQQWLQPMGTPCTTPGWQQLAESQFPSKQTPRRKSASDKTQFVTNEPTDRRSSAGQTLEQVVKKTSTNSGSNNVPTVKNTGQGNDAIPGEGASDAKPYQKTPYRVKNRAAAKRSREKTKQYEISLTAKERQLTQDRLHLNACITTLKNEVLSLRTQILEHGGCNCEMIRGYITRTANDVSVKGNPSLSYNREPERVWDMSHGSLLVT
ncbi:basic region leucine zipper [Colletotrichum nymphaeae SA-01]|uniref:Basic region leucine zipper n=1 Tax=Colletotrichum nymphaeae SA-01 TaxID=1460502 RepID=A0A135UD85_9PEZI|nr:basic region leucine zipper [Colletotrichum nymphaeae SA-01]